MDRIFPSSPVAGPAPALLSDSFGRVISYLRLSVTDRCNLRCLYCMGDEVKFLAKSEILSLEEIERLAAAFIRLGVRKLRLTGGEPLLRPGVMGLIERLGARVASGELDELTLTTNGTLLVEHAAGLVAAGVRRVNVSLDTLEESTFRLITQRGGLNDVLAGIDAARAAGLAVRINIVALAGINDGEFDRLIQWCGEHGCDLALIEAMPLGAMSSEHYLPLDVVLWHLASRWTLQPTTRRSGGPGRYWEIAETGRRLGLITPMSHAFCAECNRIRVTSAGQLVTCLARRGGADLRAAVRGSESDAALEAAILSAIATKPASHRFAVDRAAASEQPMWQLGG